MFQLPLRTIGAKMASKISRNDPCPCGSGKKYKRCCIDKDFDWVEDDDGQVRRQLPASEEILSLMDGLESDFIDRHGRAPGPDDKIFDTQQTPEEIFQAVIEAMEACGIEPALVFAYEATGGLMVGDENEGLISDVDLAAFEAAILEYEDGTGTIATKRRFTSEDVMKLMQAPPHGW